MGDNKMRILVTRPMQIAASAICMVFGVIAVTGTFRDLPMDERPEWMAWQMILWPLVALGFMEIGRLQRLHRHGLRIHADRLRLLLHGVPALGIAALPEGTFTNWVGPSSPLALLDFPTAKVMAALWLAYTLWASWEVGS